MLTGLDWTELELTKLNRADLNRIELPLRGLEVFFERYPFWFNSEVSPGVVVSGNTLSKGRIQLITSKGRQCRKRV